MNEEDAAASRGKGQKVNRGCCAPAVKGSSERTYPGSSGWLTVMTSDLLPPGRETIEGYLSWRWTRRHTKLGDLLHNLQAQHEVSIKHGPISEIEVDTNEKSNSFRVTSCDVARVKKLTSFHILPSTNCSKDPPTVRTKTGFIWKESFAQKD